MKPFSLASVTALLFGFSLLYLAYLIPVKIYNAAIPVLAIDIPVVETNSLAKTELETYQVESDNKSLVFVGDIMLARHVEYLMEKNGPDHPFASSEFLTEEPAILIGNFEATVPTSHKRTPNFNFQFSVNKTNLIGLVESGFTHLSLANNHSLDYGQEGYDNTVRELTASGITSFGKPKSLGESTITYVSASNTKYALIGLNETQMDITSELLRPYIEEASANSDVQIVYIHWGEEYVHHPTKEQRVIATILAEAGVDIIVGHHPHVIQSIERINNTTVFYSLGNYIFDQYFSIDVMEGLAIRLTRVDDNLKISLIPISSAESYGVPQKMTGLKRDVILAKIADYSDENMAEMILGGEVSTPISLATSTEMAIMKP